MSDRRITSLTSLRIVEARCDICGGYYAPEDYVVHFDSAQEAMTTISRDPDWTVLYGDMRVRHNACLRKLQDEKDRP